MTREQLLALLKEYSAHWDTEYSHARADERLLEYTNDPQISAAYMAIERWYALPWLTPSPCSSPPPRNAASMITAIRHGSRRSTTP